MAAVYKSLSRASGDRDKKRGESVRKNKQRVLILSSRGVTYRHQNQAVPAERARGAVQLQQHPVLRGAEGQGPVPVAQQAAQRAHDEAAPAEPAHHGGAALPGELPEGVAADTKFRRGLRRRAALAAAEGDAGAGLWRAQGREGEQAVHRPRHGLLRG
ncbi:hypothetical protein GP486_006445 [Trichoglossum hirsutum]|uniref:Uncharacterized protein n=1 Tax=Trichoglossum hirsutum TaxID=265104 RepID=A0A9P8IIM8_9PEZI|nr:hypothetical protein GP486_006445 [Trichoglossum hirsutum]